MVLGNGVRGLIVHIPEASVMTFDINFRAGEYLVKPDKWETPHLMEHMLLGANASFPRARDFHAEFEKNALAVDKKLALTTRDVLTYLANLANSHEW